MRIFYTRFNSADEDKNKAIINVAGRDPDMELFSGNSRSHYCTEYCG